MLLEVNQVNETSVKTRKPLIEKYRKNPKNWRKKLTDEIVCSNSSSVSQSTIWKRYNSKQMPYSAQKLRSRNIFERQASTENVRTRTHWKLPCGPTIMCDKNRNKLFNFVPAFCLAKCEWGNMQTGKGSVDRSMGAPAVFITWSSPTDNRWKLSAALDIYILRYENLEATKKNRHKR